MDSSRMVLRDRFRDIAGETSKLSVRDSGVQAWNGLAYWGYVFICIVFLVAEVVAKNYKNI